MATSEKQARSRLRRPSWTLEAAQYIALDPDNTDLAHDLIAWAHETADRAAKAHNVQEVHHD
ncbi:hypothetical protein F2T94_17060 [Salmonella enterica]|nr:hypothetical protein [Salmonella enterica]